MPSDTKKELRLEALARRDALPAEDRARFSALMAHRLQTILAYTSAHTIMFYVSFGSEVDTRAMITGALAAGRRVAVPKVVKREGALVPSLLLDPEKDLVRGAYGILEPKTESLRPVRPSSLDLVIVPGVAFDPQGCRIGYGGGYYDRFLPSLDTAAVTLALAFEAQVLPTLPAEAHDRRMDYVLTETRLLDCRQEA